MYIRCAVWVELKKLTKNYKGGGNLWDFRVVGVRVDAGSFLNTQGLVTGEPFNINIKYSNTQIIIM